MILSSYVSWVSQGNHSNPNRRPLWDFKVSSNAQAEKRRVCLHGTSHERNCSPGAELIYLGSVPGSDSFLGFHLGMIFLMPDNAGVLWFMEKWNCFPFQGFLQHRPDLQGKV